LFESQKAAASALLDAWKSDDRVDTKKLAGLIDDAKIEALAKTAADDAVKAHAVLSPEQRKQIIERVKQAGERHWH
jgi:hypothetical protein